ncbi:unnamed protein product [Nezara viridula]|uniref:Alpha-carbonic anhydrase domain-containing protein n=1 Tax=Nezara viridula TaxID=85310 RepID=A0A9P0HJT4_NEZVI|nr:unnamed protein product [Nezara viridula]
MRPLDKKTGQASKQPRKEQKKRSDILIPSFTPEELIKLGKQYAGLESPIDISFPILTEAHLRPLEWVNFEKSPKRMKISNSGTTAILSAKWHGPRPYLSKGPLTGFYVFSQLHFHWGSNLEEGSEHTMDGRSLPLEVHVMFFKNTYLTQEDAMKQTDGTVTVAYLFTLQSNDNEDFNPIISAIQEIQRPLTSYHLELLPLQKFLNIFTDDYFMYWGNVVNRSILWLVCRRPLGISARQLSFFHSMTGINEKPITKNFRSIKEINHRTVYHINASRYRSDVLIEFRRESRISNTRKTRHGETGKNAVGIGDGKLRNDQLSKDGSAEKVSQNLKDDSIHINISVHTDEKMENVNSISVIDEEEEVSSLHRSTSNNEAINLEKKRKSQIKFQLASALLNLEKEEGNDYGFLEKYLQTKFDTIQQDQCCRPPSSDEKQEGMLLPSVRSLRMNSFEDFDSSTASTIRDKSKSDTNCFKKFATSNVDSDCEIGETNKSCWSSMNNMSEKESRSEGVEELILQTRPKTSAAKLLSTGSSMIINAEERVLTLRSSSKLAQVVSPPSRTKSITRAVLVRKPSSEKDKAKNAMLSESSGKSIESTVEEARAKIRSSLKQSLTRLSKLRGSPLKDSTKNQKPDSRSSRPAWRY